MGGMLAARALDACTLLLLTPRVVLIRGDGPILRTLEEGALVGVEGVGARLTRDITTINIAYKC